MESIIYGNQSGADREEFFINNEGCLFAPFYLKLFCAQLLSKAFYIFWKI